MKTKIIMILLLGTLMLPHISHARRFFYGPDVPTSYLLVHCEEGAEQNSWPYLVEMVGEADYFNVPLTILLCPSWAEHILANPELLDLVVWWQYMGHEIGMHHHGASHGNWDGYSNLSPEDAESLHLSIYPDSDKRYIGDMDEFMAMLELVSIADITVACVTDFATDLPDGVRQLNPPYINYNYYESLNRWDVYGAAIHVSDYIVHPWEITDWFQYLYDIDRAGRKRDTASGALRH